MGELDEYMPPLVFVRRKEEGSERDFTKCRRKNNVVTKSG